MPASRRVVGRLTRSFWSRTVRRAPSAPHPLTSWTLFCHFCVVSASPDLSRVCYFSLTLNPSHHRSFAIFALSKHSIASHPLSRSPVSCKIRPIRLACAFLLAFVASPGPSPQTPLCFPHASLSVKASTYQINQPLYVFPRLLEHPSSSSRSTVVLSLLLWLRRTRSSRILCLPISYLRAFAIAYSSVLPGMHHINVVVVCFLLSPMRTRNCCQYICPLLEFLSRSLWLGTSLSNIFWH